ncbi:gustatory receptor for sugar taste 64f-like [Ostrinia furnacalis]|uniref:gustatory receptor for sugar taste 64f-like n=1 Tax=Ostrinia furnacalis TaxID=93504 RepID=UPI00103CDBF4|nr:gustatory receptor for sugar taste 64f-like [Ostrinia furnacalis]
MRLIKNLRIPKPDLKSKTIDLERKLNVTRQNIGGLHSALRLTLFSGRLLGVLPLVGLMNERSDGLKFTLRSWYSILYIISLFGQILMSIMTFYWLLQNRISLTNFTNFLFYSSSAISFLILAKIGRYWPKLVMKVEAIEGELPPLTTDVSKYCTCIMVFILAAALVEHLFSIFYGVTVASVCDPDKVAETFFHYDMPWIFTYTSYASWKGVLAELFNIQATFIWSYNDLLIMVISVYLTEHFKTLNQLFENAIKQGYYSCDEFRTQHLKIIRLVKLINERIGIYIVICFGSNLYWICTQLFYSLNKSQTGHFVACQFKVQNAYKTVHGIEHTVYFTYSFSFLVARTLLVLLLAARVHSASVVPLVHLYEIPSHKFNVEVERFIAQINNIKVALSGLDFFYVTKTMILTLLGTIVTYELVLLQFNKDTKTN